MCKSLYEWGTHFSGLAPERLDTLIKTLETLRDFGTLWEEYRETGLPALLQEAKAIRDDPGND